MTCKLRHAVIRRQSTPLAVYSPLSMLGPITQRLGISPNPKPYLDIVVRKRARAQADHLQLAQDQADVAVAALRQRRQRRLVHLRRAARAPGQPCQNTLTYYNPKSGAGGISIHFPTKRRARHASYYHSVDADSRWSILVHTPKRPRSH